MLGLQPDYLLRLSRRTTVVFAFSPSTPQSNAFRRRSQLLIVTAHQAEPNFRNASICDGEVTLRVKSCPDSPKDRLPLYTRKRTQLGHRAMSENLHKLGSRRFNHLVQRGRLLRTCRESDHRSGVPQDAARFRKTISLARSTKARKLAAIWRRPG